MPAGLHGAVGKSAWMRKPASSRLWAALALHAFPVVHPFQPVTFPSTHPPLLPALPLTRPSRLDARSVPQLPAGFAAYLQVAGLIAFLLPAGALLALAAGGHGSAGLLLFGGYLLAFVPQMLMEVKLFNREWNNGALLSCSFAPQHVAR